MTTDTKSAFDLWAEANPEDFARFNEAMGASDIGVTDFEFFEGYSISSEENAEYVLGLMANLHSEIARRKAAYAERIARLNADLSALEWRFRAPLREWAAGRLSELYPNPKHAKKSLPMDQATLKFVSVPAGIAVTDPAAALNHCFEAGIISAIRIKEELSVTEYKRIALEKLREGEELLPGAEFTPSGERFDISFKDGGK